MPSNTEIAYSMIRREVENLLAGAGLDVRANPFGKMAWESLLRKYDPTIKGFLNLLVAEPPESIDAGCEVLKEEVDSRVSGLAERMKQKMQQQNEGN